MSSRPARVAAVIVLISATVWMSPLAVAVTPPLVDDSLLPDPRPPAPPQATEQRQDCLVSTPAQNRLEAAQQLDVLDLPQVWPLSRGEGQTVAVIDTGVARHRLLPHLVPGGDYVFTGDGTDDCDGHGTIVAGIVGAAEDPTDGAGFSGVAPDATIVGIRQSSVKFAPAGQSAPGFGDVDTLASAVRTAADMGATVINVSSIACVEATAGLDDRALGAALAYAVDVKNVVVVAAAGNVGGLGQCPDQNPPADPARPGRPDWGSVKVVVSPAWYDDYVLTVGSVDPQGAPSRFTLAGPWVDVAAPGEGVVSLDADGEGLVDSLPVLGNSDADRGDELCSARGEWHRCSRACAVAAADRAAGDATDPRHRTSSPGGLGPIRRARRRRRARRGQWRRCHHGHGGSHRRASRTRRTAGSPTGRTTPDPSGRRIAFGGAGVCVAVVAAAVAMTASLGRLRRHGNTVTRD